MANQEKKVLFRLQNLKKYFPLKKKAFSRRQEYVRANESISLSIYEGETLGLVGESGCGKSTLGRTLIQIYQQTEGSTLYYGSSLAEVAPEYAVKAIRGIPREFPNYIKALEEIKALYAERDAASGDDNVHELEDKLMKKRREIQNKYMDMVRLAGGLLVSDKLSEVSTKLEQQFKAQCAVAKIEKEIATYERRLANPEYAKEIQKLNDAIARAKANLPAAKDAEAAAVKEVDILRDALRGNEDFAHYEEQRDDGINLSELTTEEMRPLRKDMQIIFQDPYSSLDTRMTLGNIIGEGVMAHDIFKSHRSDSYNDYIKSVMQDCGLAPYFIHRYPHQFSGGQRQRIGIARALAVAPKFVVCDEAVSALDVSIQSQVINLLQDLKEKRNLTYLFITHDLSVVKYISDRIAVMYLGMVVELASSERLFDTPSHPYTQALLAAIPRTDVDANQKLSILEGDIPSAVRPPSGCRFHTRCRYSMDRCTRFEPDLQEISPNHFVACHLMDIAEDERKTYMAQKDAEELVRQNGQAK